MSQNSNSLTRKTRQGEPSQKIIKIFLANHDRLRSFLMSRLHDEATVEDLLQQSLSRAIESPPLSKDDRPILAWFYQTLRNALVDHYRKRASDSKKFKAFLEELERDERTHTSPSDSRTTLCACFKDLLPTLKPEFGEVLNRVDIDGEPPEKVALELGIARNTLDVRLHRARKALKQRLLKTCGACTEHGCLDCTCR